MARKIEVEIVGDSRSLERAFNRSADAGRKFRVGLGTLVKSAAVFGIVGGAASLMGKAIGTAVGEWKDQVTVAAQTNAVLKSTGGVANVSAKAVSNLAGQISSLTGIDDEVIQSGENLLLTFKKVRNELGSGNAIFDRATKAAVDLSKAGFGSISTTAKQLGKALNDPIRGMTALGRAGVTFSEGQKATIKRLVETGDLLKAQKIILKEVESQVGGSAKAYGRTLPGGLARLRESIKNTFGGLVARIASPLAKGVEQVNRFVAAIGKARGIKAKFNVTIEGLKDLGQRIFATAEASVRRVDWEELVATVRDGLFAALRKLGESIDRINFSEVGQSIGRSIASSLNTAGQFLESVDWEVVGGKIVKGITDFIKAVPWNQVADTLAKLLLAAIKGSALLLLGAGKALGGEIMHGIGVGLRDAEHDVLERLLQFVVKVLGVTGFLGRFDPFKGVRERAKKRLDALEADVSSTSRAINTSLQSIQDIDVTITIDTVATFDGKKRPEEGTSAQSVAQGSARKRISDAKAAQAAKTARATAKARAAVAAAASDAAAKAASASKAAAQRAAAVAKKAAEARDKAFGSLMDSLALKFDRAQATKGFKDDLKTLTEQETAVRAQIAAAGRTTDLERRLFEIGQERKSIRDAIARQAKDDAAKARQKASTIRQGKQFRALGLSSSGDELTPTADNLRKQLGTLSDRVADAPGQVSTKLTSRLAGVRKLLAGAFGILSEETRKAIADLFATIRAEFESQDKKGPLTKTTSLNSKSVLAGLGLSGDQERELRGRLSGFNSAGVGLAGKNGATGSFVGGPVVLESTVNVNMDGHQVTKVVTRGQQKRARRNPPQRRGPNRGGI